MTSYNNNQSLKQSLIQEMREHIAADRLIKGIYGKNDVLIENFRGCSVACYVISLNKLMGIHINTDDHNGLAEAIGLPNCGWLTWLQDRFFERLPEPEHKQWALDFLEAIPVGVPVERIQLVKWKFLTTILTDTLALDNLPDDVQTAITRVRDLCERAGAGDMSPIYDWSAAATYATRTASRVNPNATNANRAVGTGSVAACATYVAIHAANAALYPTVAVYTATTTDIATYAAAYATGEATYDEKNCTNDPTSIAVRRKWSSHLLNLLRKAGE